MYSQQELDDAVAAGVISAKDADGLRAHVEQQRSTSLADEEQFRLITGFNDIFVSIAAAILLFAVGWIGQSIGQATGLYIGDNGEAGPSFLAPLAIAGTSWALALFFTAKRRMALPSILLLLAFVGAVLTTTGFLLVEMIGPDRFNDENQLLAATVGGVSAAIAGRISGDSANSSTICTSAATAMPSLASTHCQRPRISSADLPFGAYSLTARPALNASW